MIDFIPQFDKQGAFKRAKKQGKSDYSKQRIY